MYPLFIKQTFRDVSLSKDELQALFLKFFAVRRYLLCGRAQTKEYVNRPKKCVRFRESLSFLLQESELFHNQQVHDDKYTGTSVFSVKVAP